MHLLNERNQIRALPRLFRQWVDNPYWGTGVWSKDRQRYLLAEIEKLDVETVSAAAIAALLGPNPYVTPGTCDECGARSWDIVELGEDSMPESRTAAICLACLERAVALARGA